MSKQSKRAYYEGNLLPLAIYHEDTMVGFVMFEEDNGENGHRFIWRLMIDKTHQGKGYAKAAMLKVIDILKGKPDCEEIWLSFEPENLGARRLYVSLGFVDTGQYVDDEVCMKYVVSERN